jgi:hypothetical protein
VWQREKKEKTCFLFATLHHPVFLFLSLCHTSSPSLPFPFSLPHFITKSSLSFLFATLHHPVFLFLSLCHTSSPSLPFPFSLPHFITKSSFSFLFATLHHQVVLKEDLVMKCGKEKGNGRLGDEV